MRQKQPPAPSPVGPITLLYPRERTSQRPLVERRNELLDGLICIFLMFSEFIFFVLSARLRVGSLNQGSSLVSISRDGT